MFCGFLPASVIQKRLERAREEAEGIEKYDYFVINDELDRCALQMHQIIQSEHDRTFRNKEFINQIRRELESFSKGE